MKKTFIKRIMAAMLSGMMLIQNVPFSAFAEGLTKNDNSEAVTIEEEMKEKSKETAEPSAAPSEVLDFSSMRLLVCTEEEASLVCSVPTTILSEFEGVYLLSFDNEADTREAYNYYSTVCASAEPDISLFVADDEYLRNENASANTDALKRLSVLLGENSDENEYDIALIDTGVPEGGFSVISESAEDDNGHGGKMHEVISDVSPTLSVLSVKAFDSHGIGSVSSVYAAICYAAEKNVDVIDLPFAAQSAADSPVLERAVSMANEKGITVIGAAGNNHADAAGYIPGRVSGVIIAGACDDAGLALPTSNYGETVFCNVAAQSTSEAATRLSAMVAAYGMEQVEAEMGSGIVFRCGETVGDNVPYDEELSPAAEDTEAGGILPIDAPDADVSYPDFDRKNPPKQEPTRGNGVAIDHVYLRWLSQGETGSEPFGTLELAPDTEISPNQQFQIDFDLSGQYPYEPGSVRITIPAYLWEGRDGEECGTLTLSVPEDPETGAEFSWKREGDQIVITNVRTLPATSKVMIQGTFRNVDATEIEDETLTSFQATVTVTGANDTISMDSNDISAHMDTHIKASDADKTAYDGTTGKYTVWWGELPPDMPKDFLQNLPNGKDDTENYLFVRWYVSGEAEGNQPFEMTVYDEIDNDLYGGIMLGVSDCAEGNVRSANGKNVSAKLYGGFSTLPQTAYVWTAYKIDQLPKDQGFDYTTISNKQEIRVVGEDDRKRAEADGKAPVPSKESAKAEIRIKEPTEYTFTKIWNDKNNEAGHRPDHIDIKIYSKTLGKTTTVSLYPSSEGGNKWTYTWNDNGQSQEFTVQEILSNAEGYDMEFYDSDLHQYRWRYFLNKDDPEYIEGEDNKWVFPNEYEEKWVSPGDGDYIGIGSIKKNSVYAFSDQNKISKRDNLSLNKLMLENDVYVPYTVDTVVSAASQYLGNRDKKTVFALEDKEYILNDNKELTLADMDIGAVTFIAPKVYRYAETKAEDGKIPKDSEWYKKERVVPSETTLYGKINGEWEALAVWKATEDKAPENDDEYDVGKLESSYDGVEISGSRIKLPEGVAEIRLQLEAAAAFVEFKCNPEIRIHPTASVRAMIEKCYEDGTEYSMLRLYNKANSYAAESENAETHYADQDASGDAYLHGKKYKIAADLNKEYTLTKNDTAKKQLVLHAAIEMTQQSNVLSLEDFRAVAESGEIPYSKGGTYYDLLPYGVEPDLNTITLTNGDRMISADIKNDYKDTGRILLIVQVEFAENLIGTYKSKYPKDTYYPAEGYRSSHVLEFDSYLLHDTFRNRDDEKVDSHFHNIAAFEAKEDKIGSITGWQGEKDDPTGIWSDKPGEESTNNHKRTQEAGSKDELKWMKGLDPESDDPSFVYGGSGVKYDEVDVGAQSSLEKYVKVDSFGSWSTGVGKDVPINVQEGGRYVYRLQVSSARSDTRDIIVIDSLENYFHHDGEEGIETLDEKNRWHGYLESIDDSAARGKGINVVTYYYTGDGRPMVRKYSSQDGSTEQVLKELQTQGWTTTKPDDMKTVKAVAFDLRKTTDDNDYILKEGESIPIRLYMRAPDEKSGSDEKYLDENEPTNPEKNGHAYNEIYMSCSYTDTDPDSGTASTGYSYLYWDYTKVGIYSNEIKVIKTWDDADDADLKRPDSVKVWLVANGDKVGESVILDEGNNWTHTFSRLDTYDEKGELITYSVEEEPVDGYTPQTALTYENGKMVFTLNNVHEPEKTEIPVTKKWEFGDDGSGENKLPGSITFRLLADGAETGKTLTIKPDASGKWYGVFTDLVKNKKGKEIVYTVAEDPITDFVQTSCEEDKNSGFIVTNKYHPFGDIVLTKIVTDGTKSSKDYNLKEGNEQPFRFTLQLYTEDTEGNRTVVTNKYPYYIYDSAKSKYKTPEDFRKAIEDDADGLIPSDGKVGNGDRISLLEGQQYIIKDVPTNVKYTLTETARKEYELEKTVNDEGTIQSGIAAQAEFTNRYITKGTANIEAWKHLSGRTLNGYQFRFELRDGEGTLIRSANNDASGKVTFNLGYTNADNEKEFTYYITEVNAKMSGYKYDGNRYMVKVYPKDNGDGTMTCEVKYFNEDGSDINVTIDETTYDMPVFQNEYHASGEVKFVAWKDLDGRILNKDEFTFELYDEQSKLLDTKKNNENGVITFKELPFTEKYAGKTYRYFAKEVNGSDEKVIYDTHVICYVVEVIDNGDGTLDFNQSTYILDSEEELNCAECKGTGKVKNGDDEKNCDKCKGLGFIAREDSDTPVFKNSLEPGALSVTKQVTEMPEDEEAKKTEFTFHIRLVGDKIKKGMEFIGSDGITYTLDENGEFTVEVGIGKTITFEGIPAGTAYQVWEDDEAGWYLSERKNASGLIKAKEKADAVLTNAYDKNKTVAVIVGTKLLDNKPAHQYGDETFRFRLIEIVNGEEVPVGGPVNATEGGFIQFSIEYKGEGTHTYIIREVDGENKDLVYDEHDENVIVEVKKDGKGFLKATVKYVNTEEDTDSAVRFENYTAPGALQISKVGEGLNDVNDQMFTFEVSFFNENGIPLSGEALEYYLVDRDGKTDKENTTDTGVDSSDEEKQSDAGKEIISQNGFLGKLGNFSVTGGSFASQILTARIASMTMAANDGEEAAGETPAQSGYEPPDESTLNGGTELAKGTIGTSNKVKWRIIETNATVKEVVLLIEPEDGVNGELTGDFAWKADPNYKSVTTILTKGNLSARNVQKALSMFQECSQLVYADLSGLDLSYNGDNGEITYLFNGCRNLTDVKFKNTPIVGRSAVNTLFLNCEKLQRIENLIVNYNGTQTVNGNEIFSGCKSLTSFDLSSWKIDAPMSAYQMFYNCPNLGNVTFGENWKNTKLTTMSNMFRSCTNLTTIDAQNLNTSQVTDMRLLFLSCTNLRFEEKALKGWDTSKVENFQETFSKCGALTSLDLSEWNTSKATSMRQMFCESSITTLKVDNWYVGNVTTMYQMFYNCKKLSALDLSSWKWGEEAKLTDLQQTFVSCVEMTKLNVSGWKTSAVTTLWSTFDNCQKLTDIVGVEDWNTSSVTNMTQTFYKCWALKKNDPEHKLDLSKWETGNVISMKKMFSMESTNSNLEKIIVPWDTSKVTDMDQMFYYCSKLKELDLSTWDTSSVTNMERMFAVCWQLADDEGTIKGVKNFKTDKVTTMYQMFLECKKVTSLDLSGWNTDRVTTISQMFQECTNLEKLDISSFNTKNAGDVSMSDVFNKTKNIREITIGANFYASANYNGGKLSDVPETAPYNGKWVQKDELNLFERSTYTSGGLMDMLRENPTLQATTYVWDTLNYYTVQFKPGVAEGEFVSGSMKPGRCDPDEAFILPDNKFTRYGYVFTGWRDEEKDITFTPAADGKVTIPAKTYKNEAEITLTAQWVKYDTTKGLPYYVDIYKEKPDNDESKTADSKYYLDYTLTFYIEDPTKPTTVTMPDDTIDEPFYVAPEAKKYEISSAGGIVRIPLYYDLKRFTIKFDPNGDGITGTPMSDIEMVGDAAFTFGNTYINGSNQFIGWNTQKDGDGLLYGAGKSYTINDFEFEQGGSITLYAIWMDNSTTITPTAGKITVQCRAGDMIVFPNLPAGTTYTVKEINLPSGWEWVSSEDDQLTEDRSAFTGTIKSNQYVQVQAVNVYRATGGGILQAHKRYDGDTLQQGDFRFDLFTMSDAQVSFTGNYNEDGSFDGVVKPHASVENTVTANGAEKLFVVLHYNTEDKTEASVEVLDENSKLLHTFKGSGTEYLSINGSSVKFKANSDNGVADYHATVYNVTTIDTATNGSLDQLAEIQDENGNFVKNDWYNTGLVTFAMQNYTEPGEYVYYICEQNGGEEKIEYDEHIVKAVVTVTDRGDGSFATEVKYYDLDENMNAEKASGALFVNKKKTGQLALEKKLIDASGAVGDTEFIFTIYMNDAFGNPLNGTFELVEGDYTEPSEEEQEKQPDSGSAEPADPPKVKEPLTITFENGVAVLPIKGGEKFTIIGLPDGAKYSVEEKKLTYFEQTDASGTNGEIESNTTSRVSITNTYRISDELRITAMKNFIGGDLGKYTFDFELLDNAHNVVQTAQCDSDGLITFSKIEFTEADIGRDIYYYIREVKGTESNIQYDTEEKCVLIQVGKGENNQIQLKVYVIDPKTGLYTVPYTDKEQLKFTNVFLYDLTVSKSVTGSLADQSKKFGFTLTLENEAYALPDSIICKTGSGTQERQLDESGELTFELSHGETITFSGLPPDTKYTITESEDKDYTAGITVSGDESANIKGSTVSGTLNANVTAAYLNSCNIISGLPCTGGMGTAMFYVFGAVLTALGVLYIIRRRRSANKTAQ